MIEDILARLIEKVENRYYGKYRGFVTANNDEEGLGRIRAKVPQLLGDQETGWCLPCMPYGGVKEQGFFALPEEGAGVWIEFEGGDLSHPIWSGTWWSTGEIPESAASTKKVLKTKNGHKITIDDEKDEIDIAHKNGSHIKIGKKSIILEKGSKNIKLTGEKVSINGGNLEVE